jgi:hypothetical protein
MASSASAAFDKKTLNIASVTCSKKRPPKIIGMPAPRHQACTVSENISLPDMCGYRVYV